MLRLGHISDLHVADRSRYPRHGLSARDCERHSTKALRRILKALDEERLDHLVVTGDLTQSGEQSELERVRDFLAPWSSSGRLTLLPGNHDVWSLEAAASWRFLRTLGPDGRGMRHPFASYPLAVELSPEVTLIALDSARFGEDPFTTTGLVGTEQLSAARELARSAAREERAVVLALHHHLVLPHERVPSDRLLARTCLADAHLLVRLVADVPFAAILHGHRHVAFRLDLPGPAGPTPVLCSGSASRNADEPVRRPRAQVYCFDRRGLRSCDAIVAAVA